MLSRTQYLEKLRTAVDRAPVTAVLGPRQCGKTTLAKIFADSRQAASERVTFFDLESEIDRRRLTNPEMTLASLDGLVVIDEIQLEPQLFSVLRVVVDKPATKAKFVILGSAAPSIVRGASESLAGRIEMIELHGFDLLEVAATNQNKLWERGGFPRSYLADELEDSRSWREAFVRTFLERDIPQLGIRIPAPAMRRFWTMLAHYHGQTWKSSELARSMGLSDKTVRSYLDLLTGTYMVRQLQPWFENMSKRQVKSPKIYLRDSGLLHTLLEIHSHDNLLVSPRCGASWEGFAIEQILRVLQPTTAYYWATQAGAELDLMFTKGGKRLGFEIKFQEAPRLTRSMRVAMEDLRLSQLFVIYPGEQIYDADENISVWPLKELEELKAWVDRVFG